LYPAGQLPHIFLTVKPLSPMAKLKSSLVITGKLDNLSIYRMWGVDDPVVRRAGGPTREQIKTSPKFTRVRENNMEMGGSSTAAKWFKYALWPQKALADYNITGQVNALMRSILYLDTKSIRGQRHVLLTKNPGLMEGFSLNRKTTFDSVVRCPLAASIDRNALSAQVVLPALIPGINFFGLQGQAVYSIIAVLGIAPDVFYDNGRYLPHPDYQANDCIMVAGDWCPVLKGSPATTLDIQLNSTPPDQSFSLVLSVGIRYGALRGNSLQDAGSVEQVKRRGCAKILMMR
jgi:hypothetical protein